MGIVFGTWGIGTSGLRGHCHPRQSKRLGPEGAVEAPAEAAERAESGFEWINLSGRVYQPPAFIPKPPKDLLFKNWSPDGALQSLLFVYLGG